MRKGKILIVDDNEEILLALKLFLGEQFEVVTEKNPNLIPSLLKQNSFDLFIIDMNFSTGKSTGNEGIFWMREILKMDKEAIIIFITAYGDIELSVRAIKEGATDFIQKPWVDEKLLATVLSAYKLRSSRMEIQKLKAKQAHISQSVADEQPLFFGESTAMKTVWETIRKVAITDANILILGENGTGKELIAREIHKISNRSKELFVKVDLASLSESLFESELFGHKKGSFTDAKEDRTGRIEVASEGTLFLDEIGNISLNQQSKLLSVIQNKQVTRIGDNRNIPIDIRLITATNKPLYEMAKNSEFREDLLYRINTIQIEIPPLRIRTEDIPPLLDLFMKKYSEKYKMPSLNYNKKHIQNLQKYSWPGNIREFEHLIEKAIILNDLEAFNVNESALSMQLSGSNDSLNLENNEKQLILKAINKAKGNYSSAADVLGISRKTLYNKLKKYGL
ncbi:MAG: sigma-54-dependent Fis family transcriptional regulator [Bacteroidetes bacterium HGW-Bacteroidetes-17]|jgi:DNA-binding NtrC family response regulator|nr:MAG: sigma-54-dependent Fis family transcriptional regulator [Bacteroidetes bacterium HGW-Bacteroidetes-17]